MERLRSHLECNMNSTGQTTIQKNLSPITIYCRYEDVPYYLYGRRITISTSSGKCDTDLSGNLVRGGDFPKVLLGSRHYSVLILTTVL